MTKTRTYQTNLGFNPWSYYRDYPVFLGFARIIKTRIRVAKLDAIVLITGYNGHGKSSCVCGLASLVDTDFDYTKQIVWHEDADECAAIIESLGKFQSIWYDEGVNQFSSDDWSTSDSKKFNKEYTVNRSENKAHFICIPNFKKVNTYMRNNRVFFWVHIYKRKLGQSAKAKIMYRDTVSPFTKDPFHMGLYEYYKKYYTNDGKRRLTAKLLIKILGQLPNVYSFDMIFPPMPPRFEKKYDVLKDERKRKNKEKVVEVDSKYKQTIGKIAKILLLRGYTNRYVSKFLNISRDSVTTWTEKVVVEEEHLAIINKNVKTHKKNKITEELA